MGQGGGAGKLAAAAGRPAAAAALHQVAKGLEAEEESGRGGKGRVMYVASLSY